MFYLVEIFRIPSPGDSTSSDPEKTAPRRQVEEPGYLEVLQQRAGRLNIKRLVFIEGNKISQIKECSTFLLREVERVWAH